MRGVAPGLLTLVLAILAARAQESPKEFTDPVALLKAVAKTYAAGADTFRMPDATTYAYLAVIAKN